MELSFGRLTVLILALLIAIGVTKLPTRTTVHVRAVTGSIVAEETTSNNPVISLPRCRISNGLFSSPTPWSGEITLQDSVSILIRRQGSGPLAIEIRGDAHRPVATRSGISSGPAEPVFGALDATLAPTDLAHGTSLLVPLAGTIQVGRPAAYASTGPGSGFLLDGEVETTVRSLLLPSPISLTRQSLYPGDMITITGTSANGIGFLIADENPGLQFHYSGRQNTVVVTTLGGAKYRPQVTLFQRLAKDPSLQTAWAIFALLLVKLPLSRKFTNPTRLQITAHPDQDDSL